MLRVRETPCLNYFVFRRGQATLLLFDKPGLTDGVILQFQKSYHKEASVLQGRLGFRAESEVERVLDALPIGTSSKAMSTAGRTLENGIVPLGSGRRHTIHRRPAFRTLSPDLDWPLNLFNRTLRRHLIVKRGPGAGIIKVQSNSRLRKDFKSPMPHPQQDVVLVPGKVCQRRSDMSAEWKCRYCSLPCLTYTKSSEAGVPRCDGEYIRSHSIELAEVVPP